MNCKTHFVSANMTRSNPATACWSRQISHHLLIPVFHRSSRGKTVAGQVSRSAATQLLKPPSPSVASSHTQQKCCCACLDKGPPSSQQTPAKPSTTGQQSRQHQRRSWPHRWLVKIVVRRGRCLSLDLALPGLQVKDGVILLPLTRQILALLVPSRLELLTQQLHQDGQPAPLPCRRFTDYALVQILCPHNSR